jgi:hypothetical protein
MPHTTQAAKDHEPIGDPDHVSFGENYYWKCSCGRSAPFMTTQKKAVRRGAQHEKYCEGKVTVEVSK